MLVYFHGGGFWMGSLETEDNACRLLTNAAGCIVVSVGYRLAPENKFPTAVEDGYAAVRWVAENANAMKADRTRIAVGGASAGGNVAAVVALMARDRGSPQLVYQLLMYPVLDYAFDTPSYRDNAEGYMLTKDVMAWCWSVYLRAEADGQNPYASPLRAQDLGSLPTALVITAEYDPLRDEGEAYAAGLRQAGVPVVCKRQAGAIHGGLPVDMGREVWQEAAAALQSAFSP
jgi:acetyl esterase